MGAPRETWTAEDLVLFCRHNDVRTVSLMHVGGDGWLKALDFAPHGDEHLRNVLEGGERADGSSLFAGLGIPTDASDIVLRPRPQTAFLDPFAERPTLALLCGHAGRGGRPLPQSPDTIARRAWRRLRDETGTQLWALGEIEFFLGRDAEDGIVVGTDERGYHAASPFVFGEKLRRRALLCLSDLGVPIKYAHSEVGYINPGKAGGTVWEQHEIELGLLPLPDAADAVVLVQWVVRNLAHLAGLHCSMQPMMSPSHAGNGLHFHLAPRERGVDRGGRDSEGRLTEPTLWLLAGLAEAGAALMAFGNRVADSFVRLQHGKETPQGITWGEFDRSALVRLPIVPRTEEGRPVAPPTVEFRLPDGSAHPHLVLAGIAQAMVWARSREDLEARVEARRSRNAASGAGVESGVPTSFEDVGRALAAQRELLEAGGVFPDSLVDTLLDALERGEAPA